MANRIDYFHVADAPAANALKPAVAVAVLKDDAVLMIERRDNGLWSLPGGTMDIGESVADCAVREVEEETGFRTKVELLVGIYSDPDIRIAYADGEVRQEFSLVVTARIIGGDLALQSSEVTDAKWVSLGDLADVPAVPSQARRLVDLIRFLEDEKPHLR